MSRCASTQRLSKSKFSKVRPIAILQYEFWNELSFDSFLETVYGDTDYMKILKSGSRRRNSQFSIVSPDTGYRAVKRHRNDIFIGLFPQKSPIFLGSMKEIDLQVTASYVSSPPCTILKSPLPTAQECSGPLPTAQEWKNRPPNAANPRFRPSLVLL